MTQENAENRESRQAQHAGPQIQGTLSVNEAGACLHFQGNDPEATPVVLLHGLLSSVYFWWPDHLDVFGDGDVYSVTLPGHYPAPALAGSETLSAEFLVNNLIEQIDRLIGDRPCVIVGHSTGAQVALLAAARHPARFEKVIAMCGAVTGKEDGGIYAVFQWLAEKLGALGRGIVASVLRFNGISKGIHKLFLKDVVADYSAFRKYPDCEAYVDYYFPAQQALSVSSMGLYFRDLHAIDLAPEMKQIECPVLVLCGDKDPYVSVAKTREMASVIPNSETALIAGSGHIPMLEEKDLTDKAIRSFLGKTA